MALGHEISRKRDLLLLAWFPMLVRDEMIGLSQIWASTGGVVVQVSVYGRAARGSATNTGWEQKIKEKLLY